MCDFALTIYSIRPSFIPKLITSFPVHRLMLPPTPSCSAVSAVLPVLTKGGTGIGKMPQNMARGRRITASGLTFSTKCQRRQANLVIERSESIGFMTPADTPTYQYLSLRSEMRLIKSQMKGIRR